MKEGTEENTLKIKFWLQPCMKETQLRSSVAWIARTTAVLCVRLWFNLHYESFTFTFTSEQRNCLFVLLHVCACRYICIHSKTFIKIISNQRHWKSRGRLHVVHFRVLHFMPRYLIVILTSCSFIQPVQSLIHSECNVTH